MDGSTQKIFRCCKNLQIASSSMTNLTPMIVQLPQVQNVISNFIHRTDWAIGRSSPWNVMSQVNWLKSIVNERKPKNILPCIKKVKKHQSENA